MDALHFLVSALLGAACALGINFCLRLGPAGGVRKTQCVPFVRGWRPLTPAQIAEAMNGWTDSDPRWRALWDLLSTELEGALADLSATGAKPEELARWAGRIEMLLHWRAQLLALRRARADR